MPANGEQYRTAASVGDNPFEPQIPRIAGYTAREIAVLQSRLDRQLGPEYISTRPGAGGGKVHYLAAEKVINLANEVFGFNGWSSQIQNVQIDFVDDINGRISLGLSIITRVTLRDGTYHEDIGYGHIENCKGKAAAFEKAKKEAATDALKRALRNFGNVLGNCLYDKDYLSRVTKMKIAPSKWDAENLHRHADFAPEAKREAARLEAKEADPRNEPQSHPRTRRGSSTDVEIEDEFGDNVFDGVEMHESNTDKGQHPNQNRVANNPPQQRQGPSTTSAQQRTNADQPSHTRTPASPHIQQPPRPNNTTTPLPRTAPQPPRQQPPRSSTPHATPPPDPQEPSIGFVTGRAAELLSNGPPTPSLTHTIPHFNPKAESPSIRRTAGFDHSVSRAIPRHAQGAPLPAPQPQTATTTDPVRPVNSNPQQQQHNPPNVINPSADPHRKIGMPPAPGRASGYKPPGPASGVKRTAAAAAMTTDSSRTPLRDVSNVATAAAAVGQGTGPTVEKKIRTTATEGEGDGQVP